MELARAKADGTLGVVPTALYFADLAALLPQQLAPFEKVEPAAWYVSTFYPEVRRPRRWPSVRHNGRGSPDGRVAQRGRPRSSAGVLLRTDSSPLYAPVRQLLDVGVLCLGDRAQLSGVPGDHFFSIGDVRVPVPPTSHRGEAVGIRAKTSSTANASLVECGLAGVSCARRLAALDGSDRARFLERDRLRERSAARRR